MRKEMVTMLLAGLLALTATFACPSQRGPGAMVRTADFASGRAAHTATLLPDGRVLIAGGFTGRERWLSSTEIFDPKTNAFHAGPTLAAARAGHTATQLADGRILIAGGFNGEYLRDAEIYDPRTGSFAATGSMTKARSEHAAVFLDDGRVLVVGGVGAGWTFLADAEIFDPRSGTFKAVGSMSVARESHTATLLSDGRVLVVGGHRGRRSAMEIHRSAEIFDPRTGAFAAAGDLKIRRHKHDAVRLRDGRVLIVGGSDEREADGMYSSVEVFDPKSRIFSEAGRMSEPRFKLQGTSVVMADGRVLIAGGGARAEIFDPVSGLSTAVPGGFDGPKRFSTATRLADGRVLIAGGYDHRVEVGAKAWLFEKPD